MFYSAKTGKETPEEWREGKRWTWTKAGDNGHRDISSAKKMRQMPDVFQKKSALARREEGWAR